MSDTRWARSDLELMVLASIQFLGMAGYGSAIRHAFEQINESGRAVPSIYGYLKRAVEAGHVFRFMDREGSYRVVRYYLTSKGRTYLTKRLYQLQAAGHLSQEVLREVGIQPHTYRRKKLG